MQSASALVNHLSNVIAGLPAADPTPAPTTTSGGGGGFNGQLPDPGNVPVVSMPSLQAILFAALGIAIVFLSVKMGFKSDKDKPKQQLEKLLSGIVAVFTAVVGIGVTTIALFGQQILAFVTKVTS